MSLSFYHAMLTFLSVFYDGNLEQKNHISNDKIKGWKIQLVNLALCKFYQYYFYNIVHRKNKVRKSRRNFILFAFPIINE